MQRVSGDAQHPWRPLSFSLGALHVPNVVDTESGYGDNTVLAAGLGSPVAGTRKSS